MKSKLRCALLCEDEEQELLFRPILERLFRQRPRVAPRRPNGGFTFVLARLAHEAKYLKQRPKEAVALLVVIDGDQAGFQGRRQELHERLHTEGFDVKKLDRIAICVPSRNVETWELWLCGFRDLDEHTDYKAKRQSELKNVRRSQLLEAWFAPLSDEQRQMEAEILPALASGRAEIDRLKKLAKA